MKKIIILFFLCLSINVKPQNKQFSDYIIKYQLDYIYNPNKPIIKTETMLLLTNKNESVFQGIIQRNNDSVVNYYKSSSLDEHTKLANMIAFTRKTKLKYKILKKKNKISYKEKPLFDKTYVYNEIINFKWKITNDVKIITGYNCQKALLNYGGRNITAWFTKEIPINEGPYKFKGLPGLIIKLFDEQEHYVFNLLSVKKGKLDMTFNSENAIRVSKKQFYDNIQHYRENRVQRMIQKGFRFRSEEQKKKFREKGKSFRSNELELKID